MAYKNKEDKKKYAKWHYENNKAAYIKRALIHKKKSQKIANSFVREYLLKNPCVDCGEKDIIVLEFDHVSGIKLGDIAHRGNHGWSIETIKLEIEKCEVRCANCHRRVTYKRKNAAIKAIPQ